MTFFRKINKNIDEITKQRISAKSFYFAVIQSKKTRVDLKFSPNIYINNNNNND